MSSYPPNHYLIPVADDDSDGISGRMRARVRKKRKRSGFRSENSYLFRVFRLILRNWMYVIFVPAVLILLFYEVLIIGGKSVVVEKEKEKEKESDAISNLNRLDVRTRIVNGVREPCLKILPLDELQKLDFPKDTKPSLPLKTLVYKSKDDTSHVLSAGDLPQQYTEVTRFNLFTGNQTLQERDESFKVSETAVVHCGFYSGCGGFKISDEDRRYMNTCKAVVSTCAFGGGDDLYQPIGMTEASLEKVCYVAFWDEITRSTQEEEGKSIDKDGMIGYWHVVVVQNLPFSDQRLNGKIPKMLSHRLFPQARYSVWVDSKSQFRRDPLGVFEALLWRTNSDLAISEHGARSSVYDEAKAVVKKHKATPEEVEMQMTQYQHDGFPDEKRFNGKKALNEASVIVREHTPLSNLFMCLWFNEVVRFTSRDQLSFPYVLRRLKILEVNMFPVCTRKDLVNSMGHKRKVKPLSR